MDLKCVTVVVLLGAVAVVRAQERPAPNIGDFNLVSAGNYQVLAQDSMDTAWQVNRFMNEMLKQYARYFSNWSLKAGARVVVFSNLEDFRSYSTVVVGGLLPHGGLAGYCHLKTDDDGNTFYELVTYVHDNLWQVLAHEGFHQFLGYELGLQVPVWLNEGMAQYFETSYAANGRLHTGIISKPKLRAAQYLIYSHQAPSLGELLQMDRATFYGNAQVAYPMSWALVYYLMNRDGTDFRSSSFRRYLQDLKFRGDDLTSFQRRFGRDSAQWQADFERFILQLRPQDD
ncbi:MAG TPA: DUF1570 domain-containing protein [Verrucomicrobiae bacterium]|nr:DUF1570 domain-containing protein [Verrucomicrobiae bacterium]